MSDLRPKMIRLAASMTKGSNERKALLNVLAAKDFDSMTMPELEKAVAKSFGGAKKRPRTEGIMEMADGTNIMFSRFGGKTFINVYKAGESGGKDIPITSVADAVAKIKKAK